MRRGRWRLPAAGWPGPPGRALPPAPRGMGRIPGSRRCRSRRPRRRRRGTRPRGASGRSRGPGERAGVGVPASGGVDHHRVGRPGDHRGPVLVGDGGAVGAHLDMGGADPPRAQLLGCAAGAVGLARVDPGQGLGLAMVGGDVVDQGEEVVGHTVGWGWVEHDGEPRLPRRPDGGGDQDRGDLQVGPASSRPVPRRPPGRRGRRHPPPGRASPSSTWSSACSSRSMSSRSK